MARLRPHKLSALLVGLSLMLWLVWPAAGAATHQGEGIVDSVRLQVSYQPARIAGVVDQLVAELRVVDGPPLAGVEVEFLREVDFLGSRRIHLGRATTDAAGLARVPITLGEPEIRLLVRFRGNEDYEAIEYVGDVAVAHGAGDPNPTLGGGEEAASLAVISSVMPSVLALATAAIWLVLLGLTAMTLLAIRRNRPSHTGSQEEGSSE
jgi:hypothetical protein